MDDSLPPQFSDPVPFIEAVVWCLRMADLVGKGGHSRTLLMSTPDCPLAVLTPAAPEDYCDVGWKNKKNNKHKGHIILAISYLSCANFPDFHFS